MNTPHCPVRIIPTGLDLQRFAVPRDDALRSRLGDDHVTVTSDSGRHTTKRVARYTAALAWFQLYGKLPE